MRSARVVTVVIVSPGDVAEERTIAEAAIHRLKGTAAKRGLVVEVRKWEDVRGGYFPGGVQARIQQELKIENCDLLIAIFWKRYGAIDNPPYSRTATEVLTAMNAKRQGGVPEVIAYFSQEPSTATSKDELEEQIRVFEFKQELRRNEVLTKDFIRGDLGLVVTCDVLDYLDDLTLAPQQHSDLRCHITCIPSHVRMAGYTERIGDIQIAFTGTLPLSASVASVDVKISLPVNVTSRFTGDGLYDSVVIISERGIVGNGQMRWLANTGVEQHVVHFSAIPLGQGGSRFDEILTITGIRIDAECIGLIAGFATQDIRAGVEITLSGEDGSVPAIARKLLPVAIICRPLCFSISTQPANRVKVPVGGESNVYAFLVRVGFLNNLRTHAQEGPSIEVDHGTVLVLAWAGLPDRCEVFATAVDVQPAKLGAISEPSARAVAVRTTPNGVPVGPILAVPSAGWDGLPLFRVENHLAAWELIRPIQIDVPELVFGLAFLVPRGIPPMEIMAMGGLAPFFSTAAARSPSRTLPIPRFAAVAFSLNLTLGE
jgi:hypothetical protein